MSRGTIAQGLAAVPLFAALRLDVLERLARSATVEDLPAGGWLFREGDPADAMYVVTAGSIEVVAEGITPTVVRTIGRGESIGELALLMGEQRSLSVRARRNSQVTRVEREDFEALLLTETSFALALTRVLGDLVRQNRAPSINRTEPPRIIAVIPLHAGAPAGAVAADLAEALKQMGRLAYSETGTPIPLEALDRLEATHDRVLLVATDVNLEDAWTAFCVRQADRVVGVAARPLPDDVAAEGSGALSGCDVAFVARAGVEPELTGWLAALDPRTTHIIREGSPAGTRRMARRLAGRALGVVLSGGGARGWAHIGVMQELLEAGYEVDRIGGASIGGIIGSLFAEGRSAEECLAIMEAEYVRTTPLKGRTIPLVAISRGVKGYAAQHQLHGGRRIEGLDINFFCVSADLAAQQLVVHRRGLVADAVSATQALPAFVPPVKDGDRLLVDGGILNNLPVDPMAAMGEGPVLAVDITGRLPPPRAPRSRVPWLRRLIVGPAAEWSPPIAETLLRSILLGNASTDAVARQHADVVVRPELRGFATMRFRNLGPVHARGREAARAAIQEGRLAAVGINPTTGK